MHIADGFLSNEVCLGAGVIAAGATADVHFTIRQEDLLFVGPDMKPSVEPGWFDIWVAPSAAAGLEGSFELVA